MRQATDAEVDIIRTYAELGREIKHLEAAREAREAELMALANGARLEVGVGKSAWGVSFSPVAGRVTVDAKRLAADHPTIYTAYSKQGQPYTTVRTFGIKE